MDKVTHEVRMENWESVIEQCSARPEGMTVRAWLEEQGIAEKTYFYCIIYICKEAAYAKAKNPISDHGGVGSGDVRHPFAFLACG